MILIFGNDSYLWQWYSFMTMTLIHDNDSYLWQWYLFTTMILIYMTLIFIAINDNYLWLGYWPPRPGRGGGSTEGGGGVRHHHTDARLFMYHFVKQHHIIHYTLSYIHTQQSVGTIYWWNINARFTDTTWRNFNFNESWKNIIVNVNHSTLQFKVDV